MHSVNELYNYVWKYKRTYELLNSQQKGCSRRLSFFTNMNYASPITQPPKPKSKNKSCHALWNFLLNTLWRTFDNIVLLQMGSTYLIRFHEFAMAGDGTNNLLSIEEWRREQQAEWDRLSPTVRLEIPFVNLSLTLTARSYGHNACSHPCSQPSTTKLCIFCLARWWGNERLRSLHCSILSN